MQLLDSQLINSLIDEVIEEFHIPPYEKKERFEVLIKQAIQYLNSFVDDIDLEEDMIARGLLKNYVFYAHNHLTNEFYNDYYPNIIQWQISKVKEVYEEEI